MSNLNKAIISLSLVFNFILMLFFLFDKDEVSVSSDVFEVNEIIKDSVVTNLIIKDSIEYQIEVKKQIIIEYEYIYKKEIIDIDNFSIDSNLFLFTRNLSRFNE